MTAGSAMTTPAFNWGTPLMDFARVLLAQRDQGPAFETAIQQLAA